jgi:RNA polymerase sigma-70 factor (ECF subfamily)
MNDASFAVWNAIPPERPDNLKAFYLTVTRNTALTKYHANTAKKRNSIYDTALDELEECLAAKEDPAADAEAKELAEAVNAFLKKLPKADRQMFVCRYWLADTVEEIAAKLHCKSNRVSVRLFRTRQKLKTYLMKEGLL